MEKSNILGKQEHGSHVRHSVVVLKTNELVKESTVFREQTRMREKEKRNIFLKSIFRPSLPPTDLLSSTEEVGQRKKLNL